MSKTITKIKSILHWTFLLIWLTSGVRVKQRVSHGNEMCNVQYFQNQKYYDVDQSHFIRPLSSSTKHMKIKHPQAAGTFFLSR